MMASGKRGDSEKPTASFEGVQEINAPQAYRLLQRHDKALLLDVRTSAEWDFVGVPLVDNYAQVEWRSYPQMMVNPGFLDEVRVCAADSERPLILLCRSGQRSREAALFLVRNGWADVYHVSDGFEGALNDYGHRRGVNGWIAAGLPWIQC